MFATFPNFTPLTPNNRAEYEAFIRNFSPLTDLSFPTLMIWWNFDQSLEVAELNGNLVISYYLPGDEKNSGLSLVGSNDTERSMRIVLSELERLNRPQRLVHIPEFMIKSLDSSEFVATEEPDYAEYIVSSSSLYPLEGVGHTMRRKIKKFLSTVGPDCIEIRSLNLFDAKNQQHLLDTIKSWYGNGSRDYGLELDVLPTSIRCASLLGMHNICLYVGGELYGFAIFHVSHDGKYMILNHVKVKPGIRRASDYMMYLAAEWTVKHDLPYINLEVDLGIPGLREHKLGLKPIGFFRKYKVALIR